MKEQSFYERWLNGEYRNEGSFLTSLLQTYTRADNTNKERLERAYPEYFLPETKVGEEDYSNEEGLPRDWWLNPTDY